MKRAHQHLLWRTAQLLTQTALGFGLAIVATFVLFADAYL